MTDIAATGFWVSAILVVYAYAGFPLVLALLARWRSKDVVPSANGNPASLSMIIPVHNERATIEAKLLNTRALRYPDGLLEVLFVSDGSTDGTNDVLATAVDARSRVVMLPVRSGKAAALNAGLAAARNSIVVFSDASIALEPDALTAIAAPFRDPRIGCVSGEDRIAGTGGEGLYGRYELFLRRQESRVHSIVGASGSFYAQRRELCEPFPPGLAPDFLSVLRTVEQGYRAISAPEATGSMSALDDPRDEFSRKVRTILRGITTLARHARLLNPVRYGRFAFMLLSHKVARWLVPFCLLALLVSSAVLAPSSPFYLASFAAQLVFYVVAAAALAGFDGLGRSLPGRISVYFTTANVATLSAWAKYATGVRQELWSPSRR